MNKKTIIIGGGIAGLSAGIYSRLNGFDTEIVEMHSITGGQCTAWERKGYRFDYCLHWLVGTSRGLFYDIWRETDVIRKDTQIIDHEIHSVLIGEDGSEFIIYANISRWEEYLLAMAPEDAKGIRRMCREMRKASSWQPLGSVKTMGGIVKYLKVVTAMLPMFPLLIKYGKMDCRNYFAGLKLKNARLKYFLNNLMGDRNFSALAILMMLSWFNQKNAGYLIGGSLPLAKRMEERYLSLGGKLSTGKRVDKILVKDNRAMGVLLSDGTRVGSDYVISAADGHSTIFDMLGGRYISEAQRKAYDSWELFTPLVQVSFGIKRKVESANSVTSILARGREVGCTALEQGYSLMNYSFDPTMAPTGKTVLVIRYESPWELWQDMDREQYKAEKEKIRQDATALLEEQIPGITKDIEVIDVATPRTNVNYTGVWKGAYEGFLPSAQNITKTLRNTLPGLSHFYMAGQWLFPGGGLPPSAMSGKNAVKQICSREKMRFMVK